MSGADWLQVGGTIFCFLGFGWHVRRFAPPVQEVLPPAVLAIEHIDNRVETRISYDERLGHTVVADALTRLAQQALDKAKA